MYVIFIPSYLYYNICVGVYFHTPSIIYDIDFHFNALLSINTNVYIQACKSGTRENYIITEYVNVSIKRMKLRQFYLGMWVYF